MSNYWKDNLFSWPKLVSDFELWPNKTALMLIDLQYGNAHREYGLGKILHRHNPQLWEYYFTTVEKVVVPNTLRLLQFFRKNQLRIIFVALGSELPDYADLCSWRQRRGSNLRESDKTRISFYKKEFEYNFLPDLVPQEGELVVHKTTGSVFNSTMLDQKLYNMGIEGIIVAGVITNGCVWASAQGASDRGFMTIMVEDACATLDEESHYAALRGFARMLGNVNTTEEVLDDFTKKIALTSHSRPAHIA